MPIIRIELFKGRTAERKKVLAKELIDAFIRVEPSLTPDAFDVIFTEVDKSNWSSGYELMSEKYPDK